MLKQLLCAVLFVGSTVCAAAPLEIGFDYEFARLLSQAARDGVLDDKTAAQVRALPASAAMVRKMRLKDTDALIDYLRLMVAKPKMAEAARVVAGELAAGKPGKYAPLGAEVVRQLGDYVPRQFGAKLTVYFIFGGNAGGFAFDDQIDNVYVNLAMLSQGSTQEVAELVAHELFHAVQGHTMTTPPRPAPGSPVAGNGQVWLNRLLYDLVQEGTAELFTHPLADRAETPYSARSKARIERNARRIGGIGTMFESLGMRLLLVPPRDEDHYEQIYGLMFYGDFDDLGYDLGWLMASTIINKDGKQAIYGLLRQPPKQFVLRYQELAQGDAKLPKFSDEFMRAVSALPPN
ncbi:MAG: DUF5700 domain-containing putative Zn-dependent protease [Pseudomonadota bacterium]